MVRCVMGCFNARTCLDLARISLICIAIFIILTENLCLSSHVTLGKEGGGSDTHFQNGSFNQNYERLSMQTERFARI